MKNLGFIFWLTLVTLLFRLYTIDWTSISWLEAQNANITSLSHLTAIGNNLANSDSGILFFGLSKFWTLIFGQTSQSFQLFSLTASVFLITAAYFFARSIYQPIIAKFYAFTLSMCPFVMVYSCKYSAITEVTLLALLNTYFLYKLIPEQKSPKLNIFYILSLLLTILIAKIGYIFVLSQLFVVLLFCIGRTINFKSVKLILLHLALPLTLSVTLMINPYFRVNCSLDWLNLNQQFFSSNLFNCILNGSFNAQHNFIYLFISLIFILSCFLTFDLANKLLPEKINNLLTPTSNNSPSTLWLFFNQTQVIAIVLCLIAFKYEHLNFSDFLLIIPYLIMLEISFVCILFARFKPQTILSLNMLILTIFWCASYNFTRQFPFSSLNPALSQIKNFINSPNDLVITNNEYDNPIMQRNFADINDRSDIKSYNVNGNKIYPILPIANFKNSNITINNDIKQKIINTLSNQGNVWYVNYNLDNKFNSQLAKTNPDQIQEFLNIHGRIWPLLRTSPSIDIVGITDTSRIYCYHK